MNVDLTIGFFQNVQGCLALTTFGPSPTFACFHLWNLGGLLDTKLQSS